LEHYYDIKDKENYIITNIDGFIFLLLEWTLQSGDGCIYIRWILYFWRKVC